MCSLSIFPCPPPTAHVTSCEAEGRLISSSSGEIDYRSYSDKASSYLNIVVTTEPTRPTVSKYSLKNTFIQKDLSFWKKVVLAWHENGTEGVLRELSTQTGNCAWGTVGKVSSSVLPIFKWFQSFNGSIYPHMMMPREEVIAEFSVALKWLDSQIRAFAWHPQAMKCAVALIDDSVKVYGYPSGITPILKHKKQKLITDLSWKPYSASILAISCSSGVIIWHIDPTSLVTRPSSACMTLLSTPGFSGVTSISWHPDGNLLASASPTDTCMMIWDLNRETGTPLERVSGGGVSFVRWSPDGHRLFCATPSELFRVWETQTWTCEKWTKLVGRVQCACWSPCGQHLFLAMLEEPVIYRLSFGPCEDVAPFAIGGMKNAIPVVDVSPVFHRDPQSDEEFKVGGRIQTMIWNKTGERLVVSFKDNSELIAVFRTKIHLHVNVDISPCGFIRGHPGELPQLMNFHDDFEGGALLTVCWTSGRIRHIPLLFSRNLNSPSLYDLPSRSPAVSAGYHYQHPLFSSP